MRTVFLMDLPATNYLDALQLQRAAVEARWTGRLARDLIILLEHPPVFTLGRRGGREILLVPETKLQKRQIQIVPSERGGNITYHGPGQLVVYCILDLKAAQLAVKELVASLETIMVKIAADWRVQAHGNPSLRGAWVQQRKLGSIGVTIRRGITLHGLAFNANTDLTPFSWINPCGLQGCAMTSLAAETGRPVDMSTVRRRMTAHLADVFEVAPETVTIDLLKSLIER